MINDPRDKDGKKLQRALFLLGRNPDLRQKLMFLLKEIETEIDSDKDVSVRDEITGPIIDALHDEDDIYRKELKDGTQIEFLYRTKIARDFLLSNQKNPSHVWEPQTTKLLKKLAEATTHDILIGGAYFGDHAIILARLMQANHRLIHAFEPNQQQAAMLERNITINNLENICLNKTGLWSVSELRLQLNGFDSFANSTIIDDKNSGFPTTAIDDYIEKNRRKISVLMLDIEGAELAALRGAINTLTTQKPYIVFEVHREYVDWSNGLENTEICRLLIELDYTIYAVRDCNTHYEMENSPIELIPINGIYLDGPPHGFNLLAIQDKSLLEDQVFSIVTGVSPKLLPHKSPALHHPMGGFPPQTDV